MSSRDGIVDEDTARTIASGRQTLGSMVSTAQTHLQKAFIAFVIGMLGTIIAMRAYVWNELEETTASRMPEVVSEEFKIIATTPFEVILLQVKLGLVAGVLLTIPVLLYYSREGIRSKDWYPDSGISVWKFVVATLLLSALFIGGLAYGYLLFFPFMFEFLATNAVNAGVNPTYSIAKWTEFILVLALSFGLAAELPFVMSVLAYLEIVPYETFRDKWRYAVIGILVFGALFSPPDPITQLMWGVPLFGLYAASLAFTKVIVRAKPNRRPRRPASTGDPADINLAELDAAGVRAAPADVFVEMDEETSLDHARSAIRDDDSAKAQAILDRFDAVQEAEAEADADVDEDEAVDEDLDEDEAVDEDLDEDEDSDVVTQTTAGMVNAFTDDETTEDDIGGWYYDIQFIWESVTSGMFYIVSVFMAVMSGVFLFLYTGGLGKIREDFLNRVPDAITVNPEELGVIALHPVEVLMFEVKISVVFGLAAIAPMVLYFAWPALEDRGLVTGNRNMTAMWAAGLLVGLVGGSAFGYLYVAPNLISYLVADAVNAEMIISYRINAFAWLIFLTTVGIGILGSIPMTMLLFYHGGIFTYETMIGRWREATIIIFALSGLVTPDSVLTMFLFAIPTAVAYLVGLALLWLFTLGGRRGGSKPQPATLGQG